MDDFGSPATSEWASPTFHTPAWRAPTDPDASLDASPSTAKRAPETPAALRSLGLGPDAWAREAARHLDASRDANPDTARDGGDVDAEVAAMRAALDAAAAEWDANADARRAAAEDADRRHPDAAVVEDAELEMREMRDAVAAVAEEHEARRRDETRARATAESDVAAARAAEETKARRAEEETKARRAEEETKARRAEEALRADRERVARRARDERDALEENRRRREAFEEASQLAALEEEAAEAERRASAMLAEAARRREEAFEARRRRERIGARDDGASMEGAHVQNDGASMEGARVQNDGASDDGASSADALDVTRVSVGALGEASARTSIARVLVDVAGAVLDEDSVDDDEGKGTPEAAFDGSLASFTPLARAIDAARLEFDDDGVADVYGDVQGDVHGDASTPPTTHASTRASIHASSRASTNASDDRCDSPSKERVDAFVRSARRRRRDALLDETMAERDAVAFELARRAASSDLETEGAEDDATETPSKVSESPSRESNITPVVRATTRRLGSATRVPRATFASSHSPRLRSTSPLAASPRVPSPKLPSPRFSSPSPAATASLSERRRRREETSRDATTPGYMRAISSAATSSSPRSSPSFSFGVAASRSPASAGSPLSVSKPNSDSASSRRRRAWGSNDPSARRRSVTPEPRANVAPPAPTSTLQNPPTAITAATRARLESREKAAEARAEARDKARRMTVSGGGHGGASRMDPGREGSSSRTEFGREGSSSPTGTPGLEPATERTPASTSRAFDVVAASARSSLARLTAATGAADAILDDGRAVLAELESRGFDLDELESAWSAPPESEARRDRTRARANHETPRERFERSRTPSPEPSSAVEAGFFEARFMASYARHSPRASPRRPTTAKKTANAETAATAARRILADDDRFRLVDDSDSVSASGRDANGLGLDSPATEPDSIATAVPETDQDRFEPDRSPLDVDRSNVISTSTPSSDVDDDFERFYARYAFEANMAARSGRGAAVVLAMDAPQTPAESEPSPPVSLVSRATSRSPPGTETRAAAAARRAAAEAALRASPGKTVAAVRAAAAKAAEETRAAAAAARQRAPTLAEQYENRRGARGARRGSAAKSSTGAVSRVANDGNRPGLAGKTNVPSRAAGSAGRAIERHGVGGKAAGARARNAARAARVPVVHEERRRIWR